MIGERPTPLPPPPAPPDAEIDARRRADTERRWCCAFADYNVGVTIGALPAGGDVAAHVVAIFAAYSIADAQS